jgi:transposase InsO family protein
MVRDMERANLSERTKQQYLYGVRFLAQFHGKALDLLTPDDIRAWEDDMVRRGLGPNIRRVHLAAVAFLYRKTLSRPEMVSFQETHLIAPGKPWQNGYAESFNSKFRGECLNQETFHGVREAPVVIRAFTKKYNEQRPHSSLGF